MSAVQQLQTGKVKWFDDQKGYGFIERETGPELFVHFTGIVGDGYRSLQEGAAVEFVEADGQKGPMAVDVQVVG